MMTKVMKKTKTEQTKNRVRMFRGVQAIIKENAAPSALVVFGKRRNENPVVISVQNFDDITQTLRTWAIEFRIKGNALTALLKILISVGMKHLPQDSRSLLKTPRIVEVSNRAGGQYWYNGIQKCLSRTFAKLSSNLMIKLNINIDGLPLFKSSPVGFWPILANIHGNISSNTLI